MVRKRTQPQPLLMGQEEEKMSYVRACEIARACDNLPPLRKEFEKNER